MCLPENWKLILQVQKYYFNDYDYCKGEIIIIFITYYIIIIFITYYIIIIFITFFLLLYYHIMDHYNNNNNNYDDNNSNKNSNNNNNKSWTIMSADLNQQIEL